MGKQDHLDALNRMNERINAHDLDFADELYARNLEWWYGGMTAPQRGLEACKERDKATAAAFPDIEREVIDVVADERSAAVRWRLRATHRGEYAGLAPTGNRVDFTGCSLFEFEGGRVVRLAVYIDAATLMRQVAATR
jgi:steroid delta-isomerase-like uncharacterized protein